MTNELIRNIDKLHTTALGAVRIRRNCSIADGDVVAWCRARLLAEGARLEKRGKNWYAAAEGVEITIHARSYTIITAHRIKRPHGAGGPPTARPSGWS